MSSRRAADAPSRAELARLTRRALQLVPNSTAHTEQLVTPRQGLYVLRQHAPTEFEATIYDPMLCLILQGRKEMSFGEHTYRLGPGDCALVSHDLPIRSRVREAPYLVVLLKVDFDVLRTLYEEPSSRPRSKPKRSRCITPMRGCSTPSDATSRSPSPRWRLACSPRCS